MASLFLTVLLACLPAHALAQAPEALQAAMPADMACVEGPRAAQWLAVKARFRGLLDSAGGPFKPVNQDTLVAAVKQSIAEVDAVRGLSTDADAVGECGFGKLFIQLLGLVTIEEPSGIAQFFQEHPAVASPVMTMILDIPWVSMAQSGWPFFGILAQINYQKNKILAPMLNLDAIDGLANEGITTYFELMTTSMQNGDMLGMATASQVYLQQPPTGSPYGTLTAMATQLAVTMDIQERFKGLQTIQESFRQVLTTATELDIALTVRWPLWGFLNVGVDVFADLQ